MRSLVPRPLDMLINNSAAYIDQVSILDAGRTGCFTTPTRQAAVEM
jgi:hypothetical protein